MATATVKLGKKGTIRFKKGTFTAQAKARGMTPEAFQALVLRSPGRFNAATRRRANLRKVLVGFRHGRRRR